MNMRTAILLTLTDSGPATFVQLIGVTCKHCEDFNVNILPGVLYQLLRESTICVDGGKYFVK